MTEQTRDEVIERIRCIREAYVQAEKAGNFEPVASFVSGNLTVLPPGHPPIEGKSTWEDVFNDVTADHPERDHSIKYSSDETVVSGDLAVDRGTGTETKIGDDGDRIQNYFKYLWTYRRTDDGSWKLTHIMWSSNN